MEHKGEWKADEELPKAEDKVQVQAPPRDPNSVKGVKHTKCNEKRAREKLNKEKKLFERFKKDWCGTPDALERDRVYKSLKEKVDELAAESDRMSLAKGVSFKDSKGVMQNPHPEKQHLVEHAINLYMNKYAKGRS